MSYMQSKTNKQTKKSHKVDGITTHDNSLICLRQLFLLSQTQEETIFKKWIENDINNSNVKICPTLCIKINLNTYQFGELKNFDNMQLWQMYGEESMLINYQ